MDSSKNIGQYLQDFYESHNFGKDGGIHEKYAWISFGFFSLPMLNFKSRRENVALHDLHHLVTGFETNWKGESSVSAWEVASGGWQKLYIPWLLTLWAMGLGVVFYYKPTKQAFLKGLSMSNSLTVGLPKKEILSMTLTHFINTLSHKKNTQKKFYLWAILSLIVFLVPFVIASGFIISLILMR